MLTTIELQRLIGTGESIEERAGLREREPGASPTNTQQRRESGQPGGGVGRVDQVGRSGVYLASGPLPEGDAEVRAAASRGRVSVAQRATRITVRRRMPSMPPTNGNKR
jgi:hypothetical protein